MQKAITKIIRQIEMGHLMLLYIVDSSAFTKFSDLALDCSADSAVLSPFALSPNCKEVMISQ